MKLSHDDIQEFKEIYREEFGEELSDADAERRARQLLSFYEIVFEILLNRGAAERPAGFPPSPVDGLDAVRTVEDASPNTNTSSPGGTGRP